MSTNIKLKRSAVSGKQPVVGDLSLGEVAINTYDGNIFIKKDQDGVEEIVKFTGSKPVENVYYVSKGGSDANTVLGTTWDDSFASVEKALEVISADRPDQLTLVEVAPGEYTTQGHIDVPDNVLLRSVHRGAIFKPETGYEEKNVFRLGSGCFVEGFLFNGWRLDSLTNPTEGFAFSFRPGANIRRAPYVHKCVVRTDPYWGEIAPPLDRDNANPLIGRGAGVILADASIISQDSIYPNIMAWGATPTSHNGIGYVAKKGGLINAVNAISLWAHKHFLALDGGQILLSSCSTQFGDYTMVADGSRNIINPIEYGKENLTIDSTAANTVIQSSSTIVDDMWDDLVASGNTAGWTAEDEANIRQDSSTLIQAISWVLETANEKPMLDFQKGLFDVVGEEAYDVTKKAEYIQSWEFIRDEIKAFPEVGATSDTIVDNLITNLITTVNTPDKVKEPSTITAIGHTWTAIMSGVALTKIPPARNFATIEESILEINNGVVISSGQDDQGSALFIGGMKIDADTGELTGAPFEQSVNRIATRVSISRSF